MKGLRESKTAIYYGIKNLEEAYDYLKNDILREHLIEMSKALLDLNNMDIFYVMGGDIDGIKLQQCMTLFNIVEKQKNINCDNVFQKVLEKFFNGEEDKKTLDILAKQNMEKNK